ncbi:Ataxin-7-like protein 1 [Acipenser ruthenus]|uniref:Ataxin-7-like protein 1 n=1 Tax=Acipenser ruthenus TaxID=7906 RepID=A0A444V767_ACIRT|nr:Ataxin-7-like protein 1 [Acipenser ruthenus]
MTSGALRVPCRCLPKERNKQQEGRAMATLDRKLPTIDALLYKPWSTFIDAAKLHCSDNIDLEEIGKECGKGREVVRLNREVVSLEKIPNLVKADGANIKMNSTSTSSASSSTTCSSALVKPALTSTASKPVPPSPEKILNGKGIIPPSLLDKKHQNGTKSSYKPNKRLSEREFDPNKYCGVLNPETKKPCTRSLTCKFCTFGTRAMGRGYYVFDRRWDQFRFALNSMVEKHLNSQMWKKIPPAADSPMPAHTTASFPVLQSFNSASAVNLSSSAVCSSTTPSYVMNSPVLSPAAVVNTSDRNPIMSYTTAFPHRGAAFSIMGPPFKAPSLMSPVPAVVPAPSHFKQSRTKSSKSLKISYSLALNTIGLKQFDAFPQGADYNRITLETFKKEA